MATTFNTTLALTGALAMLALGCQGSDDGDEHALLAQADVPCEPGLDGGLKNEPGADGAVGEESDASVPDAGPSEPGLFAEVIANGTGCPAGTWDAQLAPDGNSFAIAFSKYAAVVTDADTFANADCQISIRLRSPEGQSYALGNIDYEGHVELDQGVSSFQTARYYFSGSPAAGSKTESRREQTGPFDQDYRLDGNVETANQLWSPCGLERDLQIATRVGIRKDAAGAGSGSGSVIVKVLRTPKILWRKC